jgi:UDP-N-acetylenolpyruvoylglucosamine reductase
MMNDECRFGYRWSILKEKEWRNRYYIVSVSFMLDKNPKLNTEYQDIKDELCTENPTIQDVFMRLSAYAEENYPILRFWEMQAVF